MGILLVSVNKAIHLGDPQPCNPAGETALQPPVSVFFELTLPRIFFPGGMFFHRRRYELVGNNMRAFRPPQGSSKFTPPESRDEPVFREEGSAPKRGGHSTMLFSAECIFAVAAW